MSSEESVGRSPDGVSTVFDSFQTRTCWRDSKATFNSMYYLHTPAAHTQEVDQSQYYGDVCSDIPNVQTFWKCTWVFKEHKNTEPEVEFQQHFGFLHPTLNQAQTCWAAQSCSCALPFSWKQSVYSLVQTLHFRARYWFGGLPEERITKSATDYKDTAEVKVNEMYVKTRWMEINPTEAKLQINMRKNWVWAGLSQK